MAEKSTPALNPFILFVLLLALAALIVGVMPHRSIVPERHARGADEKAQPAPMVKANAEQKASKDYVRLALSFEENRGQAEAGVSFVARGPGYTLALSPTEAAFALNRQSSRRTALGKAQEEKHSPIDGPDVTATSNIPATILRMKLAGANQSARVEGRNKLEGTANYFIGNDPAKWQAGVSTFAKVRYSEVYPGIDIEYYGNQKQLEYDFVLAPGRDPSVIALEFAGADSVEVEAANGDLLVRVKEQTIRQHAPVTYQETASGGRREIESRYALREDGQVGFEVGAYDRSAPLVIDPVLQYSTYLGAGSGTEAGSSIAIDSAGNAYVTGGTTSTNFPRVGAIDSTLNGSSDVFVTKINAAGTALVYSTYIGGSGGDGGADIVVDSAGNAYVTGLALGDSPDFPTINAIDSTHNGGGDVFVTKINAAGTALVYSTFLGGSSYDEGNGIALDSAGNVYVAGWTQSSNFPKVNPIDGTLGGRDDAFVSKISAAGTAIVYSTYLGGNNDSQTRDAFEEKATRIAVDSAGSVCVAGYTETTDFPTVSPIQATHGGGTNDAFVTKINAAGTALAYSTYLGGNGADDAQGIAVDSAGNAYVAGGTNSANFPTLNAIDSTFSGSDAFVTKINTAGTLVYSTYLGGTGFAAAVAIAVDSAGNAYVAGGAGSDFPAVNPIASMHDDGDEFADDGFVAKLNAAGSALVYSTYLGGNADDRPNAIAIDSAGNAYLTGFTTSACFPTTVGAFDTTYNGSTTASGGDAFISKISETAPPSPLTVTSCAQNVQFSAASYTVQEDCTFVTVTVNRIGDASAAASVDYNSSDGTATDRRDYITALGKLQFAAGETSKTFAVLINEDSYAEGNETFSLNLSNPSGFTLGGPASATVTITDDASEAATNIIDDAATYVCQHYHDFLNRQPDQSGWDFWTSQITACNSDLACIEARRVNVSASFFLSIEFQQTGYLVERSYKAAYADPNGNSTFGGAHQLPVPAVRFTEFLSDSQRITRGVVVLQQGWEQLLENNKQAFFLELVQRARFTTALATTMTPVEFVDRLNQNAGNVLSASERTTAINLFGGAANTTNTTARAQAVRQVAEDQDLQTGEFNRAFVLMQYLGYLRRNPNDPQDSDYTGYDFWLTKLNQFNGNYVNAEMVKAFITSIEYRQRFGP